MSQVLITVKNHHLLLMKAEKENKLMVLTLSPKTGFNEPALNKRSRSFHQHKNYSLAISTLSIMFLLVD